MARIFKPPKEAGHEANKKMSPGSEKKSAPPESDKHENGQKE